MPLAGKFGFVSYQAAPAGAVVTIAADNWSVSDAADAVETTNFSTGGNQDNVAGLRKGSYTISGPFLVAGTVLPAIGSTVTITLGVGAVTFGADFMLVKSVSAKLSVSGRYEFELSGSSTTSDPD
jgi:hypothetical protein